MPQALPPPPNFHNPKAMIANPSTLSDQSWYADSGASHHCTPDNSNLQHSLDYQGQEQVYIGNGTDGCHVSHETTLCQEVEWAELTSVPKVLGNSSSAKVLALIIFAPDATVRTGHLIRAGARSPLTNSLSRLKGADAGGHRCERAVVVDRFVSHLKDVGTRAIPPSTLDPSAQIPQSAAVTTHTNSPSIPVPESPIVLPPGPIPILGIEISLPLPS
ncbi:hypothetical protein PIB30_072814 [Stylosanthes scabra]|uniref:Uncharacterized protein n=1 Tax=Stylosanthes scabra TaxID=79078 RepID=A0ABU6QP89_9FABA|nr:hypothetical protein [Stylosanthes scabra]